jgi:hypothetical protein
MMHNMPQGRLEVFSPKIWNQYVTNKKRAFSPDWEGPLVPVGRAFSPNSGPSPNWPQTGTKNPSRGPSRVLGLEDPLVPVGNTESGQKVCMIFLNLFLSYFLNFHVLYFELFDNLIFNHPYSHVKVRTRGKTCWSVTHPHTALLEA